MLIRQNKWRAARYGLDAQLVDSDTYQPQPARELVKRLVDQLKPTARELDWRSLPRADSGSGVRARRGRSGRWIS